MWISREDFFGENFHRMLNKSYIIVVAYLKFRGETIASGSQTESLKVFSLKNFPLYGTCMIHDKIFEKGAHFVQHTKF